MENIGIGELRSNPVADQCLKCFLEYTGFYTKLNVWGSLGLNFEYDGGPIIEIGGPIF